MSGNVREKQTVHGASSPPPELEIYWTCFAAHNVGYSRTANKEFSLRSQHEEPPREARSWRSTRISRHFAIIVHVWQEHPSDM